MYVSSDLPLALFSGSIVKMKTSQVYDETLFKAKQIQRERALRAARELQEHDIACSVMRAGPTSQARSAELRAREDTARAA